MKTHRTGKLSLLMLSVSFLALSCSHSPSKVEGAAGARRLKRNEAEGVYVCRKDVQSFWQYVDAGEGGRPMQELFINGRTTLRESDNDKDGKIDKVRVRLSTGEYYLIIDKDHDGMFDSVEKGP